MNRTALIVPAIAGLLAPLADDMPPPATAFLAEAVHPVRFQLAGARRWSPRCEDLQEQILGYLRECLSTESREPECRLIVE